MHSIWFERLRKEAASLTSYLSYIYISPPKDFLYITIINIIIITTIDAGTTHNDTNNSKFRGTGNSMRYTPELQWWPRVKMVSMHGLLTANVLLLPSAETAVG